MPNPVFERCLRDLKTLAVQHFEKLIRIMNFYHVKHCEDAVANIVVFTLDCRQFILKKIAKKIKVLKGFAFFAGCEKKFLSSREGFYID